jgi:hypothetical protein
MMFKRQQAILSGQKGLSNFYKLCMNGSYGYDIMNEKLFTHVAIKNRSETFTAQMSPNYVSTSVLNTAEEGSYIVTSKTKTYGCKTPIHGGFWTLDNAKYWYLNFIYNFMHKCLDMNRLHYVEGDTDSAYWAVAGDPNDNFKQGFKHVITNHEFYNQHVYEWFPSDFYSSDNSNPTFKTPLEQMRFDKKLLGLAIEKQALNMIALGPKCYTLFNDPVKPFARKVKGVSIKQNPLTVGDYSDVIQEDRIVIGHNTNLQMSQNRTAGVSNGVSLMSKVLINKTALSGLHSKYQVLSDNSTCAPLGYSERSEI